jgi:hypothetical protein
MDRGWWNAYAQKIAAGPELWTTNTEAARIYRINYIRGEMGGGIPHWPDSIRMGGNSGFQALQLALFWGADRVILLGYDMQHTAGRTHWHGDHKKGLHNPVSAYMSKWAKCFAEIPAPIRAKVFNATRVSALKCFKRVDLETCLSESAP